MFILRLISFVLLLIASATAAGAHSSLHAEQGGPAMVAGSSHGGHGALREDCSEAPAAMHCCFGLGGHCVTLLPADVFSARAAFDSGRTLHGLAKFALPGGLAAGADPPPPRQIL